MARARLKINRRAIGAIMRGPEAQAMVNGAAERIAAACNASSAWGGYESDPAPGYGRARARVWSADRRNDEGRDNRLVRNIDAGRP